MSEINITIDFSNFRTILEIMIFIMVITNIPALLVFFRLEYNLYKNGKL